MIPFSITEAMQSGFYISGARQMAGKTNLAKWLVKLLIDSGITVYVCDVSQAWLRGTPIPHCVYIPNGRGKIDITRQSTVFDMSALTLGERIAFVNSFAESIYKSHVNGYEHPELIVFEEAQTYLPNGCMRSLRKYTPVVDYITVGGNYNTSFGIITQFPAMVDKAPVKAAQQRYFGLSTEENDKTYIKSFIGKKHLENLINLRLGEFLYQNRGNVSKFQCEKYAPNIKEPAPNSTTMQNGYRTTYEYRYVPCAT